MRKLLSILSIFTICFGYLAGVVAAQDATPVAGTPIATPVIDGEPADSTISDPVDLDVLFIGAHPDDEAFNLSTFGQWDEFEDMNIGVVTITRGEGGGNAVGPEEGPALGLIREAEERTAVGMAGIENVFYLDKVDFYYTVSAPLTEETWGYDDTLSRVVRLIRETKPEVIITMNPSPTPGNHGHHQMAARFAVDGFYAAADPARFPEQLSDEGLSPWRVGSIYGGGAEGEGTPGPDCASTFVPTEPTDVIYGIWSGTISEANDGRTWAAIARDAQRSYASQGWAVFPDEPTDPAELGCVQYTLIDTRVSLPVNPTATTAMLDNAALHPRFAAPEGSEFYLSVGSFDVEPGVPFEATVHFRFPDGIEPSASPIVYTLPEGWSILDDAATPIAADTPPAAPELVEAGDGEWSTTIQVLPADDAAVNTRFAIVAQQGDLKAQEVVQVAPPVSSVFAPLPEVAQFREWVQEVGAPQLDSLILPVNSIGVGETRDFDVVVTNNSEEAQSGTVSVEWPTGFEADSGVHSFDDLAAGESFTATFAVTNSDATLATSNEGGEEGNYAFTITTESGNVSSTSNAALNLVPVTTVPQATTAPVVDGAVGDGEYSGDELDLSRVWEGDPPEAAADASGNAQIVWTEDGIYIVVNVTDDTLGTVLDADDAKRHWRTDSVEIAIDPLGTAPNTSSTFKVGEFPITTEGGPAAYRDADAHQGPVAETAEGFEIASTVSEPYTGYVIESFIPFSALPVDIDPENAAINIFIYDSDTEDLTGQTRLGWSTWGGVQGDPYRWGKATFEGYTPAADARTELEEPVMPLEVAESAKSSQSIAQSASNGIGLAGKVSVGDGEGVSVDGEATLTGGAVSVPLASGSEGTAYVFLIDGDGNLVTSKNILIGADRTTAIPLDGGDLTSGTVLIGYETTDGKVQALVIPIAGE